MRYHFVVNPAAGRRTAVPLADEISAGLRAAGVETTRYVTTSAGDAKAHVAGLAADACDRLVGVGGDGTLHELINGRGEGTPWPVGIVPMGTANLVGRELRMPLSRRADRITERLLASAPWDVDLLRVTQSDGTVEHALANVGAGLDAEIVHAISDVRSGSSGSGGYTRWLGPIWGAVSTFRFPAMRVTIDGQRTFAAAACIVQNAHNYGGVFRLSPRAALDSGKLDVTLIRARTKRDLMRVLAGALTRRIETFNDVKIVRGEHVRMRCSRRVRLQADGDPAGRTDAEIRVLPGAVQLLRA